MADEVESQKRALLTAIAQQGAQGREQFAANQASLEQGRTGAMNSSFARSDQIGAPQALNTALGTQAAQPFDSGLKDQQLAALAYGQQLGGINAVNSNYMSQVQAARPLVNSITDMQIAKIRADQAKAADANKYEEEDRAWLREQRAAQRTDLTAKTAEQQAQAELDKRAKDTVSKVNSSGLSTDAKDTFQAATAYGDFGTASSAIEAQKAAIRASKDKEADKNRKIADLDATIPYLREYYGITYTAPSAPVSNSVAAPAPGKKVGPSISDRVSSALRGSLRSVGARI